MKTRVVIEIEHPEDLDNVTECSIIEMFEEAGDMSWTVTVVSVERGG